jgi:hypothetical protein
VQVSAFLAVTSTTAERMKAEGPGVPGINLSKGLEVLKAYLAEVEGLAKQREALQLAEQLFDMEHTSYPFLSQVRTS